MIFRFPAIQQLKRATYLCETMRALTETKRYFLSIHEDQKSYYKHAFDQKVFNIVHNIYDIDFISKIILVLSIPILCK